MTDAEVVAEGGERAREASELGFTLPEKKPTTSPLQIHFLEPSEKTLNVLKKLHTHIFPVKYQDKFYKDCMSAGQYTTMALHSDFVVGAICCRLEKQPCGKARLYIMTIGVFAPYRRRGIGAKLLANTMKLAKEDPNVTDAYLHVQVNNDDAMAFYKSFGFEYKETIENYYRRIDPPGCHVFSRSVDDWVDPL
uniref:N-acetyltransferase domain-containing protein n=1 Tax=Pyramimonas obovata TaxID=1411642 RepID=A0A7S0RTJ0_9CHLO|mmetsp:Transcript_5135/g.10516  ORF Transcript_5135/g.10516 Transcript_5135/m.10516 type:complete len:193 (+) Transcript_5135:241-819(+)|eukprot:CAMPEP_0118935266 /NCGR_PEP_ID=MMETSP1169-20130426/15310_1 /TAXON_ID=36882 /ORGANISM="Pyramimonas obovata, Strain CCMP722" /LENGTH=192 /DNA_ID=CAMNT_0006878277 /DNA_START=239 /DNA_END=817 /DNA_ORIENTATION=-